MCTKKAGNKISSILFPCWKHKTLVKSFDRDGGLVLEHTLTYHFSRMHSISESHEVEVELKSRKNSPRMEELDATR